MKIKLKILMLILIIIIFFLFVYEPAFSIEIPRFPFDIENHVERKLAVFYSPDDVSATTSLEEMGYPNKKLFMLHRDHPNLKITMQTVPKLYHKKSIIEEPEAAKLWRMMMYNTTFASWMEIGNHGYSHSPPNKFDPAWEFNLKDTHLANDYDYSNKRFKLAREAYEEIGLDNNKIIVMRFPGYAYTDAALRALLDNKFIGFFNLGKRTNDSCMVDFISLSDGREILSIPTSIDLYKVYNKNIGPIHFDYCVNKGGILNLMDHWWDAYENNNYEKLNKTLNYLEDTYKDKIWWPFGSELALWFYIKHYLSYNLTKQKNYLEINTNFNQFWNPEWRMNMSYALTLPSYYKVKKIEYSENGNQKGLPKQSYWKSWDKLWLDVPFGLNQQIRIYFSLLK